MAKKDFISSINSAVPVEEEERILLEGEHDGIQELDNVLPPWWTFFFLGCIALGIGYILYYHTFAIGDLQTAEYNKEMAAAEAYKEGVLKEKYADINENTVTVLTDATAIKNGQEIYNKKCMACHGATGGGTVGPNLTDDSWIHGCDVKDIFKIITYGNPTKGMISWKDQLNPVQIQELSSYILTLKGTTPENPKEAQGEICAN